MYGLVMQKRIVLSILVCLAFTSCLVADDADIERALWSDELDLDAGPGGIGTSPDDLVCIPTPAGNICISTWFCCCYADITPKPCCPIHSCTDCTSLE